MQKSRRYDRRRAWWVRVDGGEDGGGGTESSIGDFPDYWIVSDAEASAAVLLQ